MRGKPSADNQATIVVRFIAKEDGAPLVGQRCFARELAGSTPPLSYLLSPEGGLGEVPCSGHDGVVRLIVPPGSYAVLSPTQPGLHLPVARLAAREVREVTAELRAYGLRELHVRSIDGVTNAPLPGAALQVGGLPSAFLHLADQGRTDAQGYGTLWLPDLWFPENDLPGVARAQGYGPLFFAIEGGHVNPTDALILPLLPGATLRGEVADGYGVPVAAALVQVHAGRWELRPAGSAPVLAGSRLGAETWSAHTGADGAFEFVDLPSSAGLSIQITAQGEDTWEHVRLAAGEVREIGIQTLASTRLSGVLLDAEGRPCPRRDVWLLAGGEVRLLSVFDHPHQTARTDEQGRFSFERVEPGTWLVSPPALRDMDSRSLPPWPTRVEVPPNMPELEVIVRASPPIFVGGRTVGADGEPVSGVLLLVSAGGRALCDGRSDDQGRFRLGPLVAGDFLLSAQSGASFQSEYVALEDLPVRAGDTDVVVQLVRGGTLSACVTDASGEVVRDAQLRVFSLARESDHALVATVATKHRACFHPLLAPGDYYLLARGADSSAGILDFVRIDAGETTEVPVSVGLGARLRFYPLAADTTYSYRILSASRVLELGEIGARPFLTSPLPPGTISVELNGAGLVRESHTFSLSAGDVGEVFWGQQVR